MKSKVEMNAECTKSYLNISKEFIQRNEDMNAYNCEILNKYLYIYIIFILFLKNMLRLHSLHSTIQLINNTVCLGVRQRLLHVLGSLNPNSSVVYWKIQQLNYIT